MHGVHVEFSAHQRPVWHTALTAHLVDGIIFLAGFLVLLGQIMEFLDNVNSATAYLNF